MAPIASRGAGTDLKAANGAKTGRRRLMHTNLTAPRVAPAGTAVDFPEPARP